jgi:hypothetical protein
VGHGISASQRIDDRDQSTESGSGPQPPQTSETQTRSTLDIGPIFVQTVHHFFPDLNDWIDQIDDPRFLPFVTYDKKFLMWWGLSLFLFKLKSRRQLDFELNTDGPEVLDNLNRLAGTKQETRPVHNTLNYFLGRIGTDPVASLRTQMVRRLIRMKALDDARLQSRFLVAVDGTGYLVFDEKHCEDCLIYQHGESTLYKHQALEGKLLGPAETVISIATEFIDNRDVNASKAVGSEQQKQDCELKALRRLAASLRQEFPQLPLCLTGDSLFACGEGFQIAKDYKLSYVYVFKEGRMPAVWEDFQSLLKMCPDQKVVIHTPDKETQVYRWVEVSYTDSDGRPWSFTAIQCEIIDAKGERSVWAWVTDLEVNHKTVIGVASKGGRPRWRIENQGFNTQKNSDLNLEHVFSHKQWGVYYYLLQIAHLILQLVEKGNLLRKLAEACGKRTAVMLFGSLKNMAKRLLESLRYQIWPEDAYGRQKAARIQIRLDSG